MMDKRFILVMVALLALIALPSALGAAENYSVTLTLPADSATISGSAYKLTSTLANTSVTTSYVYNTSWFYTAAGGSATYIGKNTSAANQSDAIYLAFDTQPLFDATTYTITTCVWTYGTTQAVLQATTTTSLNASCDTSTLVKSDVTKPICSITVPVTNTEYDYDLEASLSAKNATGCTWRVGDKTFTGTMAGAPTDGAQTCAYSFTQGDLAEGLYTIYAETTDGTNITQCTQVENVRMDAKLPASRGKYLTTVFGKDLEDHPANSGNSAGAIVVIGLLGALAWHFLVKPLW